ncbi:MAG: hypothetical protein IT480_01580 [Gammaproteobacteria bacterium]|nr:hypothetical protein [Gammaproteobacteria bacterium]
MGFLGELKRRNVVRVAMLYVLAGWFILRVAGVLIDVLEVPRWTAKFVLALLVLGFPVALVLAWIYEITPQGLRKQGQAPRARAGAVASSRRMDIAIGVLAAIAIAGLVVDRLVPERRDVATAAPASDTTAAVVDAYSIAVLPFEDMSQSKDQEYFADGLSEELMNVLTRVEDLRVIGRTSSFQYKGRHEDLRAIGASLGVGHILEGSVRKAGDDLRISAQLIRSADGSQLWSQTYDRRLDNIFALQDEIAAAVAGALKLRLAAQAAADPRLRRDLEAYNRYLQGRYQLELRTRTSLDLALEHFTAAVERDPHDALAWVGLSETHTARAAYTSQESLEEGYRLGRAAAQRALDLDPALADAHAAMAYIHLVYDWNWAAADASIDRAVQLAPRNPGVLMKAALQDQTMGRFERAVLRYRQAIVLDPLRPGLQYNLSRVYLALGRSRDAEALARRVVELLPAGAGAHVMLAEALLAQGRTADAASAMAQERDLVWKPYGDALVEFARGRRVQADAALNSLIEAHGSDAAYQIAEICAERGERDQAFEWLDRAYQQRDGGLTEIHTSTHLALLESDPRYAILLDRLGLPRRIRS